MINKIIFIGAGGTGMSGVAGLLYDLGYGENLICLDSTESELTKKLGKKGIKVIIGKDKYTPEITDHVIYSEACANSTEVLQAKSFHRRPKEQRFIGNYFDFLGEISKYFTTVGITGTNGKSTTTSLALYAAKKHLNNFGLGILGALVPDLDGNNYAINENKKTDIKNIFDQILYGKGLDYSLVKKYVFIVEACEYKRHFLKLDIDRGIVTNIELDHTDYYKDLDDYILAFQQFSEKVKNKILRPPFLGGNKGGLYIKKEIVAPIQTFNFKYLFGEHNNQNGTLVFELIKQLNPNINEKELTKTIENFKGLRRRLELLQKTKNGTLIFSDYGHMASSIKFCHQALKSKYPNHKITAIFQPHQAARVIKGREDFPKSLKLYDDVIIFDIYAARENLTELLKSSPIKGIENIDTLGQELAKNSNGIYTKDLQKIKDKINNGKDKEIIIIFTAGDLDFHIRNILQK
ncbi:MAG TPA: Mur ligase family protein [Candidatus Absconditabacterales bacterium]|nr:Mur ligase family protein [Candidatus Absconditabacterales bacterium]